MIVFMTTKCYSIFNSVIYWIHRLVQLVNFQVPVFFPDFEMSDQKYILNWRKCALTWTSVSGNLLLKFLQ